MAKDIYTPPTEKRKPTTNNTNSGLVNSNTYNSAANARQSYLNAANSQGNRLSRRITMDDNVASGSGNNNISSSSGGGSSSNNTSNSSTNNQYYQMAIDKEYSALLNKEIALENAKQMAMKYTQNQMANQGMSTQGYGSTTNSSIANQYLNAYNNANAEYQDNVSNINMQQAQDEKAANEELYQQTVALIQGATDINQLNNYLVNQGYGHVDKDGVFVFDSKPANMDDNTYNQLKYLYNQQLAAHPGYNLDKVVENYTSGVGLDLKSGFDKLTAYNYKGDNIGSVKDAEVDLTTRLSDGSEIRTQEKAKDFLGKTWNTVKGKIESGEIQDGTAIQIYGLAASAYILYSGGRIYSMSPEGYEKYSGNKVRYNENQTISDEAYNNWIAQLKKNGGVIGR